MTASAGAVSARVGSPCLRGCVLAVPSVAEERGALGNSPEPLIIKVLVLDSVALSAGTVTCWGHCSLLSSFGGAGHGTQSLTQLGKRGFCHVLITQFQQSEESYNTVFILVN